MSTSLTTPVLPYKAPACWGAEPYLVNWDGAVYLTGLSRTTLRRLAKSGLVEIRLAGKQEVVATRSLKRLCDVLPAKEVA
jgi:hypothetical protein